jgi:hypothetical protein
MRGPPKPRRRDQPIAVSLEDLVPPDHFSRHLERLLSRCGWGGRPWSSGAVGVVLPTAKPVAVSVW